MNLWPAARWPTSTRGSLPSLRTTIRVAASLGRTALPPPSRYSPAPAGVGWYGAVELMGRCPPC